jgi:hypothetical protein
MCILSGTQKILTLCWSPARSRMLAPYSRTQQSRPRCRAGPTCGRQGKWGRKRQGRDRHL